MNVGHAQKIKQVKLIQKRLKYALEAQKTEDWEWLHLRALELERECQEQVQLLQVTGRIHEKIRAFRKKVLSSAKSGRSVQKLQERVTQLECDLDRFLSYGRMFKSPSSERSSERSSEEETVIADRTSTSSAITEHLSWKSSEWASQKERKSFLITCQVIGGVEEQISECALQDHRLSSHQNPRQVFPADPSVWRRTSIHFTHIQPGLVVQPTLFNQNPDTFYRMKQSKDFKLQKPRLHQYYPLDQYSSLLRQTFFTIDQRYKILDPQKDPQKWKRLKEFSEQLLTAPRELDQVDAAKALGYLNCKNDFVLSALYKTLQENQVLSIRYETVKALTRLGCITAAVVKEITFYLTHGAMELLMDILIALKTTLQRNQGVSLEDEPSLTNTLIQLVTTREHLDDVSLEAAICLAHLATSNEVALSILLSYLKDTDMKKRMQALSTLVLCMRIHDVVTIQAAIDQLSHSKMYKHRMDASYLLTSIGLQQIRQEGMERKVYDLLRKALFNDPVMAVRKAVALAAESLQMKKLIYDAVEKQLEEQNEVTRTQAVMTLNILGVRSQRILRLLLEMLDLDKSKEVRIQIIRLISALRLKDPRIIRKLKLKEQGEGSLAREAAKALKSLQRIDRAKSL
uniref:Protein HEATR9 isoform X2 n=1 Tax=Geotrypetes seraphini TaxID=260995 RepID=A0A6P8SHG4_GEOSA|nr:protein HEATR9 isoform X2 [Geotrypetes seraphini]